MDTGNSRSAINRFCPRSGKPTIADSLIEYGGTVVGFCNTGCRDDFGDHVNDRPADRSYFDTLIAEPADRRDQKEAELQAALGHN